MGPQSYRTAVFLRKEETSGMHRHRGMPCEEMMRRWAPTSKEREKPSLLRFCSWTSSLQKCEKIYFCCLHHLVYSILQWKLQQNNTDLSDNSAGTGKVYMLLSSVVQKLLMTHHYITIQNRFIILSTPHFASSIQPSP